MGFTLIGRFLHVVAPGVMAAMLQVIQVTLVRISLAFKGYVAISIAPHGQSHQPLDAIGKIKEDKQHLALLGGVDALMVHQFITQVNAGMHKKCSQQINRCESLERQYFCPEYLQRYKDSASRAENKKNLFFFLSRGAAYLARVQFRER